MNEQEFFSHFEDISLEDACKYVFSFTPDYYRMLARQGIVPPSNRGLINFAKASKALIEHYRSTGKINAGESLVQQKIRKLALEAEEKELKLKKLRGELIEVEKVSDLWAKIALNIRNKLLALPTRVAPLVSMREAVEIKRILEEIILEVLEELSTDGLSTPGHTTNSEDFREFPDESQDTQEEDSKRVGGRKQDPKSRKLSRGRRVEDR